MTLLAGTDHPPVSDWEVSEPALITARSERGSFEVTEWSVGMASVGEWMEYPVAMVQRAHEPSPVVEARVLVRNLLTEGHRLTSSSRLAFLALNEKIAEDERPSTEATRIGRDILRFFEDRDSEDRPVKIFASGEHGVTLEVTENMRVYLVDISADGVMAGSTVSLEDEDHEEAREIGTPATAAAFLARWLPPVAEGFTRR